MPTLLSDSQPLENLEEEELQICDVLLEIISNGFKCILNVLLNTREYVDDFEGKCFRIGASKRGLLQTLESEL